MKTRSLYHYYFVYQMSGKRKKAGASDDKPAKKRKPSVTAGATWHTVCRAMPKISFSKRESVLSSSSPPRRTTRSHKVTPKSTEKSKACHQDNSSKLAGSSWSACSKTVHSASTSSSEKRRKDPNYLSPLLLSQKVPHLPTSPARKPSPPPPSPVQKPSPPPSPVRKPSPPPSPARKPSPPPSKSSSSSSCSLEFVQRVRKKQKLEKKRKQQVIMGSESSSSSSPSKRIKRSPHQNHHQSSNRHQLGETVTARIGEKYKKEGGRNSVRLPVHGKIIESKGNNMYVVEFVNGDVLTLKSTQLTKSKNGITFDRIIANMDDSPEEEQEQNSSNSVVLIEQDGSVHQVDDIFSDVEDLEEPPLSHRMKLKKALEKIATYRDEECIVSNSKKQQIKWKVVSDHVVFQLPHICLTSRLGIEDMSLQRDLKDTNIPLAILFMLLAYVDGEWERPLNEMNRKMEIYNNFNARKSKKFRTIPLFSEKEFVVAHALLIGAADCSERGEALWVTDSRDKNKKKDQRELDLERYWTSISPKADFGKHMRLYRFKHFRQFFPTIWEADHHAGKDPWWKFQSAVDNFNNIRKTMLLPSEVLCIDESMSAFRPQTTKTGDLPNISYVTRKPENLGTEFKTCACPVTGILSFLEIQRGKGQMNGHKYFDKIGATASCALRAAEGGSHKEADKTSDHVREIVLADSWFGSVTAAVAIAQAGFDCILQIKQNHSLYPKKQITEILTGLPGGTKVVLTGTHSSGVNLVATGYKYNTKTILYFVSTEQAASTTDGTPYEMKWTDEYSNVHIRTVPRPELVSFFFEHVNAVDVHNHLRQHCLKLEKKWVTHNPYFRLATTLTGMNVVDTYRLARFHSLLPSSRFKIIDIDRGRTQNDDIDGDSDFTMKRFAGILSKQLLVMAESLSNNPYPGDNDRKKPAATANTKKPAASEETGSNENQQRRGRREKVQEQRQEFEKIITAARYLDDAEQRDINREREFLENEKNAGDELINKNILYWADDSQETNVSSVTCQFAVSSHDGVKGSVDSSTTSQGRSNSNLSDDQKIVKVYWDDNHNPHTVATLGRTTSKGNATYNKNYIMPKACAICKQKARTMCVQCHEVFCYPLRTKRKGKGEVDRNDSCFARHVYTSEEK